MARTLTYIGACSCVALPLSIRRSSSHGNRLALEFPLGAQPMLHVAAIRLAFLYPDLVRALPDVMVFRFMLRGLGARPIA